MGRSAGGDPAPGPEVLLRWRQSNPKPFHSKTLHTLRRASLLQVTSALAQRLISQNEGMGQLSDVTPIDVGDTPAAAVDLQGHSPLQQGGAPLYERDRIVTFARSDGNLTYIVCVAPERDFTAMKPTFDAMVRSFRQP